MNICSDGHDEIVYTDRKCPLCAAEEIIQDYRDETEQLTSSLAAMQKTIDSFGG